MNESCLVTKLNYYIDLRENEKELLAIIEEKVQEVKAREEVYTYNDPVEYLHVVKQGWFYSYTDLPDGGRHVVRIYHPGDIIGLPMLAFHRQSLSLKSCTNGKICPFRKNDLTTIFETAPRLAALLFTISSREQVIFIDTLRVISSMNSRARIAYLLLDITSHLRITNVHLTNQIYFPITQYIIGDAVGLSNESVSRTLKSMEADKLIERINTNIILLDEDALRDLCDFTDRYSHMDLSWFESVHT